MTTPAKPVNMIRAVWRGDYRFDTGRVGGPLARIDGNAETGQSPPDILLSALAACSAIDVVDILAKRKTPVEQLEVEVVGERRAEQPKRFLVVDLTFHVNGRGIERVHAERAVQLSLEKYCTVASSLARDLEVHTVVVLNNEPGERVRQEIGR
jgi:putative redox protein